MKYTELTPITRSFVEISSIILLVGSLLLGAGFFIGGLVSGKIEMLGVGIFLLMIPTGVWYNAKK